MIFLVSTKFPTCAPSPISLPGRRREWPQPSAGFDLGLVEHATGKNEHAVADLRVGDHAVGTDTAIAADAGLAKDLHEGFDGGVGSNFNITVNHASLRIENGYALGHQSLAFCLAQAQVNFHQFGPSVPAQDFVGVACSHGNHSLLGLDENGGHIGEVKLAVRIVVLELVDMAEQQFTIESVEAGVDLANLLLRRGERFLLHNGLDIVALVLANHPAVASRILQLRGQQGHGGFL